MKYMVRVFAFNVFALWLTSELIGAFTIAGGWQITMVAGFVLAILMIIIVPLLKILFIPINIITFGLANWLVNVVVIYLLTVFVPQVSISEWSFQGWQWAGFNIPQAHFGYYLSLVIVSLTITCIANALHKISDD